MDSLDVRRKRTESVYRLLDPLYTKAKTALRYETPFELLVATILSAQSTDKQVNELTKDLFKKYRTPADFAAAPLEELEAAIRPTGFFRNKAKAIKRCSLALMERYGGEVPSTMEEMVSLPGVGRKTANCVLGAVFDVPGVVVDTHVKRLAARLGLTDNTDPDKIEKDIQRLLPPEKWRRFSDLLIYHGREVCKAKKPDHDRGAIADLCPSRDAPPRTRANRST
jgi:endonuclease-3